MTTVATAVTQTTHYSFSFNPATHPLEDLVSPPAPKVQQASASKTASVSMNSSGYFVLAPFVLRKTAKRRWGLVDASDHKNIIETYDHEATAMERASETNHLHALNSSIEVLESLVDGIVEKAEYYDRRAVTSALNRMIKEFAEMFDLGIEPTK